MELDKLITKFNETYLINSEAKRLYLKSIDEEKLLNSLRNFGSAIIKGKSYYSSHFKNNRWFNKNQIDSNGIEVQFRDALIEKIKETKTIRDLNVNTFEKLYNNIEQIILDLKSKGIKGAGQMTIYDVSCYIGAKKGLSPTKLYIHRGVRDGAYSIGITPTKKENCILELNDIYKKVPELRNIKSADDIETFLCIMKNQLFELYKK